MMEKDLQMLLGWFEVKQESGAATPPHDTRVSDGFIT